MSCNGCRVLRKGCSDACVLRPSIQWIDGSDSQAHATAFVAKFFGRAALLSSLSAAPLSQRPVVFRSLLFEACGRTINPVSGAVGLLAARNWDTCQAAVETVLRGGAPKRMADAGADIAGELFGSGSEWSERSSGPPPACELELGLTATPSESSATTSEESGADRAEKRRLLHLFV